MPLESAVGVCGVDGAEEESSDADRGEALGVECEELEGAGGGG